MWILRNFHRCSQPSPALPVCIFCQPRMDGDYVQLMKVKDGGDKVDFYYKSPDGKRIVEFLMLADSDEETVVIQFESDSLTFDDVARLAAIMAQGE